MRIYILSWCVYVWCVMCDMWCERWMISGSGSIYAPKFFDPGPIMELMLSRNIRTRRNKRERLDTRRRRILCWSSRFVPRWNTIDHSPHFPRHIHLMPGMPPALHQPYSSYIIIWTIIVGWDMRACLMDVLCARRRRRQLRTVKRKTRTRPAATHRDDIYHLNGPSVMSSCRNNTCANRIFTDSPAGGGHSLYRRKTRRWANSKSNGNKINAISRHFNIIPARPHAKFTFNYVSGTEHTNKT